MKNADDATTMLHRFKCEALSLDPLAQHVLAACLSDGPYSPLWESEEDLAISFSVVLW